MPDNNCYTSPHSNIQILKYQLATMLDPSHPDGGEFRFLLVENGTTCSSRRFSSFGDAYSSLLSAESERWSEEVNEQQSLFHDHVSLDTMLKTAEFARSVLVAYDGDAAEADAKKALDKEALETGDAAYEESVQNNDATATPSRIKFP
jgi:hypothetical protein